MANTAQRNIHLHDFLTYIRMLVGTISGVRNHLQAE